MKSIIVKEIIEDDSLSSSQKQILYEEALYLVIKNLFLMGYSPLDISERSNVPIEIIRRNVGRVLVEEFGMFKKSKEEQD